MTLEELKQLARLVPLPNHQTWVLAQIDECFDVIIKEHGPDRVAPEMMTLWNDDGWIFIREGKSIHVAFGGRKEGYWISSRESLSSRESKTEVAAGAGVPEVVTGTALEVEVIRGELVIEG